MLLGAKTFAWWINQYPVLKNRSFVEKWLAGWSIAAIVEYLPLIGAFEVASANNVHLGLITGKAKLSIPSLIDADISTFIPWNVFRCVLIGTSLHGSA